MRIFVFLFFLITIQLCFSKNNVKSLTESLGQEVIEIGAPIKDLQPDLEEEPSIENEDHTTITIQAGTKKDIRSSTPVRRSKELSDVPPKRERKDDEETRIEKELAEIYKDTIDYKGDSSESSNERTTIHETLVQKPDLRSGVSAKPNFKFQPDTMNKKDVEKFRTSMDDISCQKLYKLTATTPTPKGNTAATSHALFIIDIISLALIAVAK